jgi:tetratricopeptide (TPR) repeat protein
MLLALAGLALFGWIALRVQLTDADHPQAESSAAGLPWFLGPAAGELASAAHRHVQLGLRTLNDTSFPASDRLQGYRDELRNAEALLERSLRAQPAQAKVVAQLAALRWELDPPTSESETRRFLDMISIASDLAPFVPAVQVQLAELLLKMGRKEDAGPYLARAVELDPGFAGDSVRLLSDFFVDADAMVRILPQTAEVLAESAFYFRAEGLDERYLPIVEDFFSRTPDDASIRLLVQYGSVCLSTQAPERLLRTMEELDRLADDRVEAARLQQQSRAYLALHRRGRAVETAEQAAAMQPESAVLLEHLGSTLLASGDPARAIDAYQRTLGLMARGNATPARRAGIYGRIGRSEERMGNVDRAIDAYRMALRLDPNEPRSKRRLAELGLTGGAE